MLNLLPEAVVFEKILLRIFSPFENVTVLAIRIAALILLEAAPAAVRLTEL